MPNDKSISSILTDLIMHGKCPTAMVYPMIIANKSECAGEAGNIRLLRVNNRIELFVEVPSDALDKPDGQVIYLIAHYAMHMAMVHPVRVAVYKMQGYDEARLLLAADALANCAVNSTRLGSTVHDSLRHINELISQYKIDFNDTLETAYGKIPKSEADKYSPNESMDSSEESVSQEEATSFFRKMAEPIQDYIENQCGKEAGGEFEEINPKEREFPASQIIRTWIAKRIITAVDYCRRKISKRYGSAYDPQYGANKFFKTEKYVLCAVDTSGSMVSDELAKVFGCLRHPDIHYDIMQFDTDITSILADNEIRFDKIKIMGRGGTSFQKVYKFANENSKKYSGVIVFTDGWGDITGKEPDVPWLWVLTNPDSKKPIEWGECIRVDYINK